MNMKTLRIKIDRPAYGSISIGRHEGKIVMIKGAVLPGEIAEVIIESERKDYLTARVREVIEPSQHRILPACKYYGICGGCHLQHIPYEKQVSMKEEILQDCLRRIAKSDIQLSSSLIGDRHWNYRVRGQFKVSSHGMGFYRENSREVVDIDICPLMTDEVNKIFSCVRAQMNDPRIREIHITNRDGFTAMIKLSSSINTSAINALVSRFREMGFTGICIETPDKSVTCYGKEYVTFSIDNVKYTVSPRTFLQSHWTLNAKVIKFMREHLGPVKGKKMLDMFSGAGNFSLPLSMEAEVTAVEENPYAIEDGIRNLQFNNIRNCRFINSSAEDFQIKEKYDIIILDPPRAGLTNRAMSSVLTARPERIVYISCNPATFSRDMKKLLKEYACESVHMIDFFPQTYHIESIAFLVRR
ncbi:MAG: class I SAM-dependent RNA methyltransferase [Nitrospiraceae bacterium]|nr:MAG: class I SAM-dependent RNA methyltransferase [Nitrospiraceae bacterium]